MGRAFKITRVTDRQEARLPQQCADGISGPGRFWGPGTAIAVAGDRAALAPGASLPTTPAGSLPTDMQMVRLQFRRSLSKGEYVQCVCVLGVVEVGKCVK